MLRRITVRHVGARLPNGAFVLSSSATNDDPGALTVLIMPEVGAALSDLGHPNPTIAFLDRDILLQGVVTRQAVKSSTPAASGVSETRMINFMRVQKLAQISWVEEGQVLSTPRPRELSYQTDATGSVIKDNPHEKAYLAAFNKRMTKQWDRELYVAEEMDGFRFRDASVVSLPMVITCDGLIVTDGLAAHVEFKKHPELAVVVLRAVRSLNKKPVPFPPELREAGIDRIRSTQRFEISISIR